MPIDGGVSVLDTDANNFSMGYLLQQMQAVEINVIGYASRSLCESELRYCTTCRGNHFWPEILLAFLIVGFPFVLSNHATFTRLLQIPNPVTQSALCTIS